MKNALEEFLRKQVTRFRKKAYLLRAVKSARKTLQAFYGPALDAGIWIIPCVHVDITLCVQSGFLIERKIDEKTGLVRKTG